MQTHTFFWREVEALRQMGVEVSLLSSRRPAEMCKHEFAAKAARETHYLYPPRWGVAMGQVLRHPLGTIRAIGYVLRLKESSIKQRLRIGGLIACAADLLAWAKEQKLEHIHAHSCADVAHVVAMCRKMGGPAYSLTLHGDLEVYGTDHAQKMRDAAFVACVTTPLKKQVMEKAGVEESRTAVIWMGVDTERFVDRGKRQPRANQLHLATVARLHLCKGHRHALAAIRRLAAEGCDVRYTIAGTGPHEREIRQSVLEMGLEERVNFAGTVGEEGVLELLNEIDAFVLPSVGLGEAAPVSVMEAMSCGLAVICSIIGGTADMIESQKNGILVAQGDEEGLYRAMKELAGDVGRRLELGKEARRRAAEAFDSRRGAQRLLNRIPSP
ncbi:MAG: glycosyltransferase family 4 protein [Phycisphaerales bacterium]|jgi:glycosyltransferase involved in cell wall biosynthesis|nr:glycosyltransferase family 4 protein [Phycisphaerales bacterium]